APGTRRAEGHQAEGRGMKRLVAAGFLLVLVMEAVAMMAPDRRAVLWMSGAMVAVVLLAMRRRIAADKPPAAADTPGDGPAESLRRWVARTETMLRWADSTRADWDRHLRPKLAREFVLATGQRQGRDPAALQATGRMLFGEDLWQWVDPANVTRSRAGDPGPGRATLDEVLRRLERP